MPWTEEPALVEPRMMLAAALCDATSPGSGSWIYAIGGSTSTTAVAATAAYDTASQRWSPVASMPSARTLLAATSGPGRLHALGGMDNAGNALAVHEIFEPAAGAWSSAAPFTAPRLALAAVNGPDGRVYVLGGGDHFFGTVIATVEVNFRLL